MSFRIQPSCHHLKGDWSETSSCFSSPTLRAWNVALEVGSKRTRQCIARLCQLLSLLLLLLLLLHWWKPVALSQLVPLIWRGDGIRKSAV